jgi:hypothetical protein
LIHAFLLFFPINLFAYLDPGTGSYLIQIFLASLFGAIFILKSFWHSVKEFFANLFMKKDTQNDPS